MNHAKSKTLFWSGAASVVAVIAVTWLSWANREFAPGTPSGFASVVVVPRGRVESADFRNLLRLNWRSFLIVRDQLATVPAADNDCFVHQEW